MRERPILFSALMVRAILDGSKTQTRRVVQPRHDWYVDNGDSGTKRVYLQDYVTGEPEPVEVRCPYGEIGDRLWVRESFWEGINCFTDPSGEAVSFWTGKRQYLEEREKPGPLSEPYVRNTPWMKKRPAIHMPRRASRITLEITGVRVERLQDIDNVDAMAEGCPGERWLDAVHGGECCTEPWEQFQELWQSINGPESWSANPWVWVIQFRRLE